MEYDFSPLVGLPVPGRYGPGTRSLARIYVSPKVSNRTLLILFICCLKMPCVTIMNLKDVGAKNAGTVKRAGVFYGGSCDPEAFSGGPHATLDTW